MVNDSQAKPGVRVGCAATWLAAGFANALAFDARGSFHVVVFAIWFTKTGRPLLGSIFFSQPSGRGSSCISLKS